MTSVLAVTIPAGMFAGQQFIAQTPQGQQITAVVPPYFQGPVGAGTVIYVRYTPIAAPVPILMGTEQAETPEGDDKDPDTPAVVEARKRSTMEGAPKQEDLCAFAACCCSILTCYTKVPDCLGCYNQGVFMCFELETMWCKTGANEASADGSLCLCLRGECEVIAPTTCCKLQEQLCCLNASIAFPCDQDVPCMIACLGLTCVKEYKAVFEFAGTMDQTEVAQSNKA